METKFTWRAFNLAKSTSSSDSSRTTSLSRLTSTPQVAAHTNIKSTFYRTSAVKSRSTSTMRLVLWSTVFRLSWGTQRTRLSAWSIASKASTRRLPQITTRRLWRRRKTRQYVFANSRRHRLTSRSSSSQCCWWALAQECQLSRYTTLIHLSAFPARW